MPSPAEQRIQLVMPADHKLAAIAAAKRAGLSLSAWIGQAIVAKLPANVRKTLSERRGPGQPRKSAE